MPSPFPGMNPYLEQEDVWRDFRRCFIVTASEQLQSQLPSGFYALIRHHEFYYPLSERANPDCPQPDAVVNAVHGGPFLVSLAWTECERESYIEIIETRTREPVTANKLLSTGEKQQGPHRE
jgi:hypothetical protein